MSEKSLWKRRWQRIVTIGSALAGILAVVHGYRTLEDNVFGPARLEKYEPVMLGALGEIRDFGKARRYDSDGGVSWHFNGGLNIEVERYSNRFSAWRAFRRPAAWYFPEPTYEKEMPGDAARFFNYEDERYHGRKPLRKGEKVKTHGGWISYRKGSRIVHVSGQEGTSFNEVWRVAHAVEPLAAKLVPQGYR